MGQRVLDPTAGAARLVLTPVNGMEAFWADVGRHTDVHLRYQRDTKIIDLATARRATSQKVPRDQSVEMVPPTGLEPVTPALRMRCSTS